MARVEVTRLCLLTGSLMLITVGTSLEFACFELILFQGTYEICSKFEIKPVIYFMLSAIASSIVTSLELIATVY